MPQERGYQVIHIDKTIESVSSKRKVLAQLPTGGGKTVEFCLIAKRFIEKTGKSVLILVHREELLSQARDTAKEILDIEPYLITSETKHWRLSRVYIGMVESLVKRTNMFENVGLVIIDECHIANFNKIHSLFLEEFIIGFTATPISSSKKQPLNGFYNDIIVGPQINDLIKLGYLSQNTTRCPEGAVDSSNFEVDKLTGDFNEAKMYMEYKKPKYVMNTVQAYRRYAYKKKVVIYNVNIAHSKEVNECFQHCGFNSRHLDSSSSRKPSKIVDPRSKTGECFKTEREEILYWLKITPDAILCNVGIATTGFDEATIHFIIANFSTLSLPKFIQCTGRGGRIIDQYFIDKYQHEYPYKLELKDKFGIIDMGGNAGRFGDWNWDRDWAKLFNNPEIPGDGVAPVKTCPKCEGLVHAAVTVCPLTTADGEPCLYEFVRKKVEESPFLENMVVITKQVAVDDLIKKNEKKYEYFTFYEIAEKVVGRLFEKFPNPSQTIVNTFFVMYYELCKDWYSKTLAHKDGYVNDISNSSWHIRRAKNYFDKLVKTKQPTLGLDAEISDKHIPKHSLYNKCSDCEQYTYNKCKDCGEPLCRNCEITNEFCTECNAVHSEQRKKILSI